VRQSAVSFPTCVRAASDVPRSSAATLAPVSGCARCGSRTVQLVRQPRQRPSRLSDAVDTPRYNERRMIRRSVGYESKTLCVNGCHSTAEYVPGSASVGGTPADGLYIVMAAASKRGWLFSREPCSAAHHSARQTFGQVHRRSLDADRSSSVSARSWGVRAPCGSPPASARTFGYRQFRGKSMNLLRLVGLAGSDQACVDAIFGRSDPSRLRHRCRARPVRPCRGGG
jgi:hypothetical protein